MRRFVLEINPRIFIGTQKTADIHYLLYGFSDGEMESDVPHIVNLINSVIGVGILAMPFCMSQCGLILGTIVLLFCGFITLQSCLMLISSAKAKNKTRYVHRFFLCGQLKSEQK